MFSGKTGRGVGKWDLAEKGAKLGCNTRSHPTDGNSAQSLRELWAQHRSHFEVVLTKNQEAGVLGFPGGAVVENLPADAGDTGSSPGLGRSHMLRSN